MYFFMREKKDFEKNCRIISKLQKNLADMLTKHNEKAHIPKYAGLYYKFLLILICNCSKSSINKQVFFVRMECKQRIVTVFYNFKSCHIVAILLCFYFYFKVCNT